MRRSEELTPGGFFKYRTGSPAERSATPVCFVGRKPLFHMRVNKAWALALEDQLGVRTTKAGRSLFSLPNP